MTLVGFALAAVLLLGKHAAAVTWKPDPTCSDSCSLLNGTQVCTGCRSDVVGECADGEVADLQARWEEVDEASCLQTECSTGGCPEERPFEKVELKEVCFNPDLKTCHTGACFRETCCRQRAINRCCKPVPCTQVLADCPSVPKQLSPNPGISNINSTRLPHGADTTFPFYRNLTVLEGQVCEKVWGKCSCVDGQLQPGCDAGNSSTWLSLDNESEALPEGLYQTCSMLQSCQVPAQQQPSDTEHSVIVYVTVQHGATSTFPFYDADKAPSGQTCSRVWGGCTCNSGQLSPGCNPLDSTTWRLVINGSSSDLPLAPGLALTCSVDSSASGAGTGGAGKFTHMSGLALAGIIAGAMFITALIVGAVAWYLRSRLSLKRWSQLRLGSSYQPVLNANTADHNGNGGAGGSTGGPFGTVGEALDRFRSGAGGLGRKLKGAVGGGRAAVQGNEGGGAALAPSRHLPYPAGADDDVFTLEDLDSDHRDHYPVLPVSRRAEVELHTTHLGSSRTHRRGHSGTIDSEAIDKEPLLAVPPTPSTPPRASGFPPASSHGSDATRSARRGDEVDGDEEEGGGEDEEQGLVSQGFGGKQQQRKPW